VTDPGGLPPSSEIVFYQGEDGRSRVQVRLDGGTVWLTQRLLAELYQKDVRTINEHIQNIFEEGELDPGPTIRKFRIVQTEGKRQVSRLVDHYNLEAILPSAIVVPKRGQAGGAESGAPSPGSRR